MVNNQSSYPKPGTFKASPKVESTTSLIPQLLKQLRRERILISLQGLDPVLAL